MVICLANKIINAKKYNKRITIQKFTSVMDDEGIATREWVDYATLWAFGKSLSSRWKEYFQAGGYNAEKMMQFELRYREGIEEDMRIVHNDSMYEIKSVSQDPHGDKTETWIFGLELTNG